MEVNKEDENTSDTEQNSEEETDALLGASDDFQATGNTTYL